MAQKNNSLNQCNRHPQVTEVELFVPYMKGEALTYDDLTPEQIEELQRPASEAAETLETFVNEARAEEQERQEAENLRNKDERIRKEHETIRETNETARVRNESARRAAENTRVTEFATLKNEVQAATSAANTAAENADAAIENIAPELAKKANVTDLGNVLATDPLTPWEQPDMPAYRRLFIDMWNSIWGNSVSYDETKVNPFIGNGVELSYEEALNTFLQTYHTSGAAEFLYGGINCKTNIPLPRAIKQTSAQSLRGFCYQCYCKVISLDNGYTNSLSGDDITLVFCNAHVPTIKGVLDIHNVTSSSKAHNAFINAQIEHIFLYGVKISLDLKSLDLDLESVSYLVSNALNSSSIAITVHPDVYAKLIGDTTSEANSGLTDDEKAQWTALPAQAAAKQITFVTTT